MNLDPAGTNRATARVHVAPLTKDVRLSGTAERWTCAAALGATQSNLSVIIAD